MSWRGLPGAFRNWVFERTTFEDPKWRNLSRKEKESQYGMVDLWDPVTRTKRCLSCHVGNYEEGNVLTHAMYAAGHPPARLPEVSTFSEAMPYHWEYLGEKRARATPGSPQSPRINPRPRQARAHRARGGQAASFRFAETLNLFASAGRKGRTG